MGSAEPWQNQARASECGLTGGIEQAEGVGVLSNHDGDRICEEEKASTRRSRGQLELGPCGSRSRLHRPAALTVVEDGRDVFTGELLDRARKSESRAVVRLRGGSRWSGGGWEGDEGSKAHLLLVGQDHQGEIHVSRQLKRTR